VLNGGTADMTNFGDMDATYVVLKQNQKITQNLTVKQSCGYNIIFIYNSKNSTGGSCVVSLFDSFNKQRLGATVTQATITPGRLQFSQQTYVGTVFLNPGTYTLEISGESQTDADQAIAVTQVHFFQGFLGSPITIDLPPVYQQIPTIYCTLATTPSQVTDYMKQGYLIVQQTTPQKLFQGKYSELFTISPQYTTNSFFMAVTYGPFDIIPGDYEGIVLTLNWMAVGV
jgi:hypothetical protein